MRYIEQVHLSAAVEHLLLDAFYLERAHLQVGIELVIKDLLKSRRHVFHHYVLNQCVLVLIMRRLKNILDVNYIVTFSQVC